MFRKKSCEIIISSVAKNVKKNVVDDSKQQLHNFKQNSSE